MRQIILLAVTMMMAAGIQAQNVAQELARQQAAKFLAGQVAMSKGQTAASEVRLELAAQTKGCYLFNAHNRKGWAITSAKGNNAHVLAFSEEGNIDADNMPDNMKAWLEIYDQLADGLAVPRKEDNDDRTFIAPMLTTKWGEYAPYNSLCPLVAGEDGETMVHAAAGSGAVAAAQLMRYHKWPLSVTGVEHRSWHLSESEFPEWQFPDYGKLPDTTFDWDSMPDCIDADSGNDAYEVAKLIQYIGYASNSFYRHQSTAVNWSDISQTLRHFGYNTHNELIDPFIGLPVHDEIIYNELSAGRPVLIIVHLIDEVGSSSAVVDGYYYNHEYDGGYYHVNWGWNGVSNGFYTLPTGRTSNTSMDSRFYTMQMIAASKVESKEGKGNDPTDIYKVQHTSSLPSAFYDIQGRRLTTQPRRGIYVKDGKKVVVK